MESTTIVFAMPDPALLFILFIGGMIFFWSAMFAARVYKITMPPLRVRRYFIITISVLAFVTFVMPILLWRDLVGPETEGFYLTFLPFLARYIAFVIGMSLMDYIYNRDEES